MGIPQIIVIILLILDTILALVLHGEPKTGKYDVGVTLISNLIMFMLLQAGGFWGA